MYPLWWILDLVDIGSGGAFTMPLAKMFPHLRITNQDLPEIIMQAKNLSSDIQDLVHITIPSGELLIFDQTWRRTFLVMHCSIDAWNLWYPISSRTYLLLGWMFAMRQWDH